MCKVGDLILVRDAMHDGVPVGMHPFLVLRENVRGFEGIDLSVASILLSKLYGKDSKKIFARPFVLRVDATLKYMDSGLSAENYDSFSVSNQIFMFNPEVIKIQWIGSVDQDYVDKILDFVNNIPTQLVEFVTDNLQ